MKKEVRNYLSIGFLVLAVLVLAYLLNLGITGFAVLPSEYEDQTACEEAGYVWEDIISETCTDIPDCTECIEGCVLEEDFCEEGCVIDYSEVLCTEGCVTEGDFCEEGCVIDYSEVLCTEGCEEICDEGDTECIVCEEGCVIDYSEVLCTEGCVLEEDFCEEGCVIDYSEVLCTEGCVTEGDFCEEGCLETCQDCVKEVIGEHCVGDCDSNNLNLCLTQEECEAVEVDGFWYNGECNAGEECIPDTCESLSYTCGNPDDGCGVTLNCGTCDPDDECDTGSCESIGIDDDDKTGCATDADCDSNYECDAGSCVEIPPTLVPSLSASEISPLSLNPGSSQKATTVVTNTGTKSLISCAVKSMGEFDSWILVSEETTEINIDGQHEFSFDVTVPEETEEGSYSLKVSIGCSEIFTTRDFTVNVEKKKLEFEVISADRTRLDRVRIIYSLEELAGEDQDVVFIFSLVDANNVEVGRVEVNQSIDANSTDEFRTNININESLLPINETTNETLESELTLNVNFNSQIYSSSIQEKVLIGAPIGGFAIFEGVGAGEAVIFVIVLFVLVFIFIFARRMRRKGKTLKDVLSKSPGST